MKKLVMLLAASLLAASGGFAGDRDVDVMERIMTERTSDTLQLALYENVLVLVYWRFGSGGCVGSSVMSFIRNSEEIDRLLGFANGRHDIWIMDQPLPERRYGASEEENEAADRAHEKLVRSIFMDRGIRRCSEGGDGTVSVKG